MNRKNMADSKNRVIIERLKVIKHKKINIL